MKPVIRGSTAPATGRVDHAPLELAVVAIIQLYFPDEHRAHYYRYKRAGFTNFLQDCVTGDIRPEKTAMQARLTTLLGDAKEAHLYIPRFEGDSPSHYASICKEELTGLWKVRHTKIRAAANRISFGALVTWKSVTPVPEVCVEIMPSLSPIARGKTSFDQFMSDVVDKPGCFVTKRELSQCSIMLRMFGCTSYNRMGVWFPNQNGRYVSCSRIGLFVDLSEGDGWQAPYRFSRPQLRRGVAFPAKKNVSIVATPHPIYDTGKFHSFMPTTPKLEPIEDHLLGDTKFVLEQLFKSRLIPYVGVSMDGVYVDLYSMFYYPDTESAEIVKIADRRRICNCGNIPFIKPWQGYDGYWIPNKVLADLLRHFTLTENRYLFDAVGRAMPYFGAAKIASYNKVFKRYSLELQPKELEIIEARAAMLTESQETGISTSSPED